MKRRGGVCGRLLLATALCALVPHPAAPDRGDAPEGSVLAEEVPRARNARAQADLALACDERLDGTQGRERLARRLTAVEAHRRVHRSHSGAFDVRAAGALAAGRHLTTLGFHDEAWSEFDAAVRLAAGAGTSASAGLLAAARRERADAARRNGAWEQAAVDYAWCAERTAPHERAQVLLRLGEVQRELGYTALATGTWKRALALGHVDTALVDVYDRLARFALERGDDEEAAGWLEACRAAVRDASRALTPRGQRLRHALVGMRARYELQCRTTDRAARAHASTSDNARANDDANDDS